MSSVIILGSARSNGNTRKVCDFIRLINDAKIYDLLDLNISPFDYTHSNQNDDFFPLMEQIIKYNTLIFATPVYWYTMSAQMKIFLDRFSDLLKIKKDLGRQLRGKNMQVVCCSSTEEEYPEFWKPFERSAEYLGMYYKGHAHTWIAGDDLPKEVKNRLKQLFQ